MLAASWEANQCGKTYHLLILSILLFLYSLTSTCLEFHPWSLLVFGQFCKLDIQKALNIILLYSCMSDSLSVTSNCIKPCSSLSFDGDLQPDLLADKASNGKRYWWKYNQKNKYALKLCYLMTNTLEVWDKSALMTSIWNTVERFRMFPIKIRIDLLGLHVNYITWSHDLKWVNFHLSWEGLLSTETLKKLDLYFVLRKKIMFCMHDHYVIWYEFLAPSQVNW